MGAVAYESFWLQSLSDNSNGVSQWWSLLELVAYESGESFDCIQMEAVKQWFPLPLETTIQMNATEQYLSLLLFFSKTKWF